MGLLQETLDKCGVFTYPLDVPIDANGRQSIDWAIYAIEMATENDDCYCQDGECTDENPSCSFRKLAIAKQKLLQILDPIHRSLNPDRLGNPAEDIFLRRWQKQQERSRGINSGYGLLELLLSPTRMRAVSPFCRFSLDPYYVPPVSQRDAEVAATVIQWLGTSCGLGFMQECEREIAQAKAERREMESERLSNLFEKDRVLPVDENLAREAAMQACRADDPRYDKLVNAIIAAIQRGRGDLAAVIQADGI